MTHFLLVAGAIVGNMALIFGLLQQPHNVAALWVGLVAYLVATMAWLMRRSRRQRT